MKKVLLLCLASALLALPAHADQIVLYSSGVAEDGSLLQVGDVDPHYRIATVAYPVTGCSAEPCDPPPTPGDPYLTDQPAYISSPHPLWVPNGPYSNWLSPTPGTYGDYWALYTYRTTFDLTGLDPATARISGSWAVDDPGYLYLNGTLVAELPFGWMFRQLYGLQVAPNVPSYTANHDFQLSAGFLPGINTLDFVAWNSGGGPTGVRVEIASATADPALVRVTIDVKPGSTENPVNPGGSGKIPVAILSTGSFDATAMVDVATLTFGATGDEPSLAFCNTGGEDVNLDGLPDLVCHFFTAQAAFGPGATEAFLKGMTRDGVPLLGRDAVQIVP